jgi:crotonobetainyl-CoA:carnitine CoA-transferase CaiB-like acyl-CoA transferase
MPEMPAPLLGQHTEEVLSAMGLDARELEELSAQGITGKLPVPA